jgi:Leucine-rich repeat (LRR) protein
VSSIDTTTMMMIPIIRAVAVSDSQIAAEAHEVHVDQLLNNALQRAAAAEAALAAIQRNNNNNNYNNSFLSFSNWKQPPPHRVMIAVGVATIAMMVIAAAGMCGSGHCRSAPTTLTTPSLSVVLSPPTRITPSTSPPTATAENHDDTVTQMPTATVPTTTATAPLPTTTMPTTAIMPLTTKPNPMPATTTTMDTAAARAGIILPFINDITLSERTLTYPSNNSSAEERSVRWLVEDDLGTAVDDKQSLRQRYVLGTLWFLQSSTTHFGSDCHANTWTTDIDECQWLHVYCDGNGRVTELALYAPNEYVPKIRGQIPDDLGLLTALTNLELYGNALTGTIPSSLGALTAMTSLLLHTNQLNGTIPSSLGALTALTGLHMGFNALTGTIPSSLGNLTALNSLTLYYNQLNGRIPSSLGTLTALMELAMDNNKLTGTIPSSLGALTALYYLTMNNNALTGTIPSSLGDLTALNTFSVYDNQLNGTMPCCN